MKAPYRSTLCMTMVAAADALEEILYNGRLTLCTDAESRVGHAFDILKDEINTWDSRVRAGARKGMADLAGLVEFAALVDGGHQ